MPGVLRVRGSWVVLIQAASPAAILIQPYLGYI